MKIKPKLKHEEQRRKRWRSCSLDFGPKNMHQRNYKTLKLTKDALGKLETPSNAWLNLNTNLIYIYIYIWFNSPMINSSRTNRGGRHQFLSIEINFWFGSHKDLKIYGPSGICKVDRLIDFIDRFYGVLRIARSHLDWSKLVRLKVDRLIELP